MKRIFKTVFALLLALIFLLLSACETAGTAKTAETFVPAENGAWRFGFARETILPDDAGEDPLYIAGYNTAAEVEGVLDHCEARAVWLGTGDTGVLLIAVDCVALDSGVVGKIRAGLKDLRNCAFINVVSTHTHAGPDTLGLWGPTAVDGKNPAYMKNLVDAAVKAGRKAAESPVPGTLHYGYAQTDPKEMLRDSRFPFVFDANLYQLRFEAADGSAGLRLFSYCAHPESLRSVNRKISRDYAGYLCDAVTEATGDNAVFLPGAIGGLLMTQEFVPADTQAAAEENLRITGEKMADYALSINEETEREIEPKLAFSRVTFTVPLENSGFQLFRFLGILSNKAVRGQSATGYHVETELCVLQLGDVLLTLIPGEIFPELVYGGITAGMYGAVNPDAEDPEPLCAIAAEYGFHTLLPVGLSNDELGYIVPPSDFLVDDELPYIDTTMDNKGENHYEETNSVGPECAVAVADALRAALEALAA